MGVRVHKDLGFIWQVVLFDICDTRMVWSHAPFLSKVPSHSDACICRCYRPMPQLPTGTTGGKVLLFLAFLAVTVMALYFWPCSDKSTL